MSSSTTIGENHLCKLSLQAPKECEVLPWHNRWYDTICNRGLQGCTRSTACLDLNTRFLKKGIKSFVKDFLSHREKDITLDVAVLQKALAQYDGYLKDCDAIRGKIRYGHLLQSILSLLQSLLFGSALLGFFIAIMFYVRGITTERNVIYETANDMYIGGLVFSQRNDSFRDNGVLNIVSRTTTTAFADSVGDCSTFVAQRLNCSTLRGINCDGLRDRTRMWLWVCYGFIFVILFFTTVFFGSVHSRLRYITKKIDKAKQRLSDIRLHMALLSDLQKDARLFGSKISICRKQLFTTPHYKLLIALLNDSETKI